MPRARKLAAWQLTEEQRTQLESVAQSTSMPHGLVQRARIVWPAREGVTHARCRRYGPLLNSTTTSVAVAGERFIGDAPATPACLWAGEKLIYPPLLDAVR